MNTIKGEVFKLSEKNKTVPGCTISELINKGKNNIFTFALAKDTDISAEIFPYKKFIIVNQGILKIEENKKTKELKEFDSYVSSVNSLVGFSTNCDTIYTEIEISEDDFMNKQINAGEVFKLENLVPYQEGKIVNMDVMHNDQMKFVVMSFDEGLALSEHAAPGEALIFALDGEAIIGYEGKEYTLKKGENFSFAKGGLHSVKAVTKFKMALIIAL